MRLSEHNARPDGAMLTCPRPIPGRYVIVFKPANHFLAICELKVYGERSRSSGFYKLVYHHTRAIVPTMSSSSASTLVACAIQCERVSLCFAFNFLKISNGASVTCELLRYDTFQMFQDLIPMIQQKVNWTVYFLTIE
ncbi:hypothetical protein C0Q70_20993 [Pomacea canaliculata]|uniref:Apple domain-containing protein n=1 Tax=Pomacea canaliculata TaxID=400727 RepID=A0A2T7NB94_POMCA|nr:uncharacterized protein LOC112555733 [Pomacea canaliculata]PVD18444.1 hypothetical protein C0Q70_20993 [Pomacea canaliculata]